MFKVVFELVVAILTCKDSVERMNEIHVDWNFVEGCGAHWALQGMLASEHWAIVLLGFYSFCLLWWYLLASCLVSQCWGTFYFIFRFLLCIVFVAYGFLLREASSHVWCKHSHALKHQHEHYIISIYCHHKRVTHQSMMLTSFMTFFLSSYISTRTDKIMTKSFLSFITNFQCHNHGLKNK